MKWVLKCLLFAIAVVLAYLNVALYYQPTFIKVEDQIINEGVYHQLKFLKEVLQNGAGNDMQKLFPEGFVFVNALYGLSWHEVIKDYLT